MRGPEFGRVYNTLPEEPFPPTSSTILLVEDTQSVRNVLKLFLERGGYHVVPAISGDEAVRMISRNSSFDLLVTDVNMPGLSGIDVADAIERAQPGVPVLFLSGSCEADQMQAALVPPWRAFMAKPFSYDSLMRKVKELIALRATPVGT